MCKTGDVLEVNQSSANAEGAIEFIEYLLSEEQQSNLAEALLTGRMGAGYPVQNEILEKLFDDFREEAEMKAQDDGENFGDSSLTVEQYDVLLRLI